MNLRVSIRRIEWMRHSRRAEESHRLTAHSFPAPDRLFQQALLTILNGMVKSGQRWNLTETHFDFQDVCSACWFQSEKSMSLSNEAAKRVLAPTLTRIWPEHMSLDSYRHCSRAVVLRVRLVRHGFHASAVVVSTCDVRRSYLSPVSDGSRLLTESVSASVSLVEMGESVER